MKTEYDFKEYLQAVVYLAEHNIGVKDDVKANLGVDSNEVIKLANHHIDVSKISPMRAK